MPEFDSKWTAYRSANRELATIAAFQHTTVQFRAASRSRPPERPRHPRRRFRHRGEGNRQELPGGSRSSPGRARFQLGRHVYLGGVDDVPEMLRRTFHRLLNESIDKPWHQQLTSFLGNRIKSAGLFGLTLDLSLTRNDLAGGLRILQR